ncbi:hypothetical protein [Ideonella oryzae]|uniref:PEGA domain-containing protein n=1 Tax=Ideonella oryzae TaxID=2937441 RepID=A0ABT1BKL9_9BURK|nr:hypothetical protein [Ideonella oryzae]MCO5976755.1 hypothetical protein [Ideonella oryzae]
MSQFRLVRPLAALTLAALAAGCATTTHFASEPAGAQVRYNGDVIGTAPFDKSIQDQFGWFSVYRFTASLEGYEPQTLEFSERTPLDAANVVPAQVQFTLKKLATAAEAASAPTAVPAAAASGASAPAPAGSTAS